MKLMILAAKFAAVAILWLSPLPAFANMAEEFRHPQDDARPWTYWFWINGNITREGITADLEAMKRVGIGGVLIMEVANPRNMAPEGPVKFASPEWKELFQHVVREADRLGLKVNMNNDAGWTGSGGPWVTPENSMKKIVATTATVTGPSRVDMVLPTPETIENLYRDIAVFAIPNSPLKQTSVADTEASGTAIQLTSQMTNEGRLTWDAPEGNWMLARIGYTSTGQKNKPASETGIGLEVDKFDPDALAVHFNAFIGSLVEANRDLVGTSFVSTHIDSWEVGWQNWSHNMVAEFRKRRGYDLMPWLPLLAGASVGSPETAERFRRDFALTCAELTDDYYAGAMRRLSNEKGLKLSIEGYGPRGFMNPLTYTAEADLPVSEFWIDRWDAWHLLSSRLMASVAHVYGKPVVAAESFTSGPEKDPFTEHPYSVKSTGDWAMCEGVNRLIFHRTVHDPWTHLVPGMSFAGFGWHLDRNQTWFEQSKAYMTYVARCQWLLQQGRFVADVCRLVTDGEMRPHVPGMRQIPEQFESLPEGYNYDYISDKALLNEVRVEDGNLITRAGMKYKVLQLPRYTTMTVELARKVADLVAQGATVIGPEPLQTPGLANYPQSEEKLREVADVAWDTNAKHHVVSDKQVRAVLAGMGVKPDFQFKIDPPVTTDSIKSVMRQSNQRRPRSPELPVMPTPGLNWIHRSLQEGELYFVANPQHRDVNALCTFRVGAMRPELWYPETGEIHTPAVFSSDGDAVQLPIRFGPAESVFVIFRKKTDVATQVVEIQRDGESLYGPGTSTPPKNLPAIWIQDGMLQVEGTHSGRFKFKFADGRSAAVEVPEPAGAIRIQGPWTVKFQRGRGAPDEATFQRLFDWSKHDQDGIKYFSGSANYITSFEVGAGATSTTRWTLELGDVQTMAEVRLNGKDFGVLWKQPFELDITSALRAGRNELEIKVTNLWPNRMIGDEQYPDDSTPDGVWARGPLNAWPEWIQNENPRPDPRRITFTTFKHFQKNSPLVSSGLLGPVKLQQKQILMVK